MADWFVTFMECGGIWSVVLLAALLILLFWMLDLATRPDSGADPDHCGENVECRYCVWLDRDSARGYLICRKYDMTYELDDEERETWL